MLVPIHRAVSAVLRIMLVTFVTLPARVQHAVLRSKHWFAMAAATAVAVLALVGPYNWMWSAPNNWMW
jgi:hypothetical protein